MTGDEKTPGSPEQEVLPSRDATNANATSPPQAGERVGVRGSAWTPDLAWTPDIADQSWAPTAPRDALHLRARLNRLVREFFHAREVLELETPMMSRAGNTDPNIASFSLDFSGRTDGAPRTRWLRTSPEFPLKRLLAAGVGDCYELGRVFRDGEAGGRHNPEFTMLEWYRVGWTLEPLIDETVALVQAALAMIGREAASSRISFRDLYQQRLGFDPMTAELEIVRNAAAGIAIDGEGLTRDDWLDLLMTHVLQPAFGRDEMLVVHDYPATQSALARVVERDGVPVAERFELYLGPLELANGYHELTDAVEQRARFERDVAVRQARGDTAPPIDIALLDALANGMPACAGVALGVDRLLMAMRDTARIADVVAFDFARG
jgi:lysyl-tRNA synthetase class 2